MKRANPFLESAQRAVSFVLRRHGIDPDFKTQIHNGKSWLSHSFVRNGQRYRIEIYEDSVVMHQGDRLFEPYMTQEFESDQAQIQGFCERLDRYLGGGDWEGPNEDGPVIRFFRRLFRS